MLKTQSQSADGSRDGGRCRCRCTLVLNFLASPFSQSSKRHGHLLVAPAATLLDTQAPTPAVLSATCTNTVEPARQNGQRSAHTFSRLYQHADRLQGRTSSMYASTGFWTLRQRLLTITPTDHALRMGIE